jgi:Ca2+-binding RTX toxin-like protein
MWIHTLGGGNQKLTIYNGTVLGGNGNDTVNIKGDGLVVLGSGNDYVKIHGDGVISVGGGNDHLSLYGNGAIFAGGNDTIHVGGGFNFIDEAGSATVIGAFGKATVVGGDLSIGESKGVFDVQVEGTGETTLLGGSAAVEFIGGPGKTVMHGGSGPDTLIGGSGSDTLVGGSGHNLFAFVKGGAGGDHVITNFVTGQDQLYLEGYKLSQIPTIVGDSVKYNAGTGITTIRLDGGSTVITVNGKIHGGDVTTKL